MQHVIASKDKAIEGASHICYSPDGLSVYIGGFAKEQLLKISLNEYGWDWHINRPKAPTSFMKRQRPLPAATGDSDVDRAREITDPSYGGWKKQKTKDRNEGFEMVWEETDIDHNASHNRLTMPLNTTRGATAEAKKLEEELMAVPLKHRIHERIASTGNSGYGLDPDRQEEKLDESGFRHGAQYDEDFGTAATDRLSKHQVSNSAQLNWVSVANVREKINNPYDTQAQYHEKAAEMAVNSDIPFMIRLADGSLQKTSFRSRDVVEVTGAINTAYSGVYPTKGIMLSQIRTMQGAVEPDNTPTELTFSPAWHTLTQPTNPITLSLPTASEYGANLALEDKRKSKRYQLFLKKEHERRSQLLPTQLVELKQAKDLLEQVKGLSAKEMQNKIPSDMQSLIKTYAMSSKKDIAAANVLKENLRSAIYAFCENDQVTIWEHEGSGRSLGLRGRGEIGDDLATIHMRILKEACGFTKYVDLMQRLRSLAGQGEITLITCDGNFPEYDKSGAFKGFCS